MGFRGAGYPALGAAEIGQLAHTGLVQRELVEVIVTACHALVDQAPAGIVDGISRSWISCLGSRRDRSTRAHGPCPERTRRSYCNCLPRSRWSGASRDCRWDFEELDILPWEPP